MKYNYQFDVQGKFFVYETQSRKNVILPYKTISEELLLKNPLKEKNVEQYYKSTCVMQLILSVISRFHYPFLIVILKS